jgi:1-acyl-sn-glycerol-3-phosphate acyltransferase
MRFLVLDFGSVMLGGAQLGPRQPIPSHSGVLVIMNHQSLLDIPLVVRAMEGVYPRIVTRQRYTQGIPLISHMIRLCQYPLVDPKATVRGHLRGLEEAARNGETSLVIFPEGTRSADGSLGTWKRSGLRTLLSSRPWQVYVAVADGLWRARSLRDFMRDISSADIRMTHVGPFQCSPGDDVEAFVEAMQVQMQESLRSLREEAV